MRLWDTAGTSVDGAILAFTVGDDPILDLELLPFDCIGSAAHAEMLAEIGVLTQAERDDLLDALREAFRGAKAGELEIRPEQEDCHTALEELLTATVGEAGRKIHTGRSRNDQVIAALRLLVRERLLELATCLASLIEALVSRGAQYGSVVMPGYTHTRQAMPSTVGQLLFGAAEGAIRDLECFRIPLAQASRAALGSASGYGVPLPLDRERAGALLGCTGIDLNTLHVQNCRGRLEASVLFVLHQATLTLSRLAADLVWWSSEAFGFFSLPDALTTGSSIMPNKRNPDVLELVRALPASMLARYTEVCAALHGLPSGYHRDLQRTKRPLLRGLAEARAAISIMQLAVERLRVHPERCLGAMSDGIYATDRAYDDVRKGIAFRDAYRRAKEAGSQPMDPQVALRQRAHLGAPGTDQAGALREALAAVRSGLLPFEQGAAQARSLLVGG
ncbi:MAG: argininosuccinate lyase [Deltaproteobacteria bacterium]|nr:argininosuccinate lyase [Deltaproteobacteria bacterium]